MGGYTQTFDGVDMAGGGPEAGKATTKASLLHMILLLLHTAPALCAQVALEVAGNSNVARMIESSSPAARILAFTLVVVASFLVHNNGTVPTTSLRKTRQNKWTWTPVQAVVFAGVAHLGGGVLGSIGAMIEVIGAVEGHHADDPCAKWESSALALTVAVITAGLVCVAHHIKQATHNGGRGMQVLSCWHKPTIGHILAIVGIVVAVASICLVALTCQDFGAFVLIAAMTGVSIILPAHTKTTDWLGITAKFIISLYTSWGALTLFHLSSEAVCS